LIGKTASTISSYESGSRMISVSDLPNLATALHMPISYFFGEINPASELASIYDDLPTDDQIRLLEFARMLLRLTQDS
jgi:transcriptional regulator with XRE-family HTH domain